MSNKVCCVPGCSNYTEKSKDVLHKFPNPVKDKDRMNTWIYAIGGEIMGLSDDHIFKYRCVCHRHFEEKYWCRNNLLSNIAVPTNNMPGILEKLSMTTPALTVRRPLASIQSLPEASTSKDLVYPLIHSESTEQVQMKENIEPVNPMPHFDFVVSQTQAQGARKDIEIKECGRHKIGTKVVLRKKMSKVEQLLHKKLSRTSIRLSKCRNKANKQAIKLKAMQNIVSHPQLVSALDHWPSTAKILTLLQFREYKKGIKGRRFTFEEKIMALSIFKQSPKGYRFFRRIFILPSPQTLTKLLNMADIKPGINKKIIQQIIKSANQQINKS